MAEPRHIARDLVDAQQARVDPRLPGRLQPLALSLEEDPLRPLRRPRPIGGPAPDLRPGEGDRGLRQPANTGPSTPFWPVPPAPNPSSARLFAVDGNKLDKFAIADRGPGRSPGARRLPGRSSASRRLTRSEKKRNPAAPFTTSTLQQEASRKLGFSARKTMSHGAEALRGDRHRRRSGRPDHLHANRLGGPLRSRHQRGPRGHQRDVRQGVRPGQAAGLQEQGQERPGGPRGGPPDTHRQHPGEAQGVPLLRPVPPLPTDLDAHRRLADGSGDSRCDQRRYRRRRAFHLPRQRPGDPLPRLHEALHRRDRRGRGRTGRNPAGPGRGGRPRLPRAPPRAALHPAAAALHRGEPGQDPGGVRHRPSLHLRLDHEHPGDPQVRAPGEAHLLPRGRRQGGQRPVGQPLRPLRRLRLHRPVGGGSRRHLPRRGAVAAGPQGVLGALHRPAQAEGGGGQKERRDHREDRPGLPRLRQIAGHQARPARQIPRLLGLSRVPPHRAAAGRRQRGERGAGASRLRGEVRQVRRADADQGGPLRQIPRLQRLPRVQEHPAPGQAQGPRHRLPGVQGRRADGEEEPLRQDLLLLQPLSQMQVRPLGSAGRRALPQVRLAGAGRQDHQARRHGAQVPAGKVRLQAGAGGAGEEGNREPRRPRRKRRRRKNRPPALRRRGRPRKANAHGAGAQYPSGTHFRGRRQRRR